MIIEIAIAIVLGWILIKTIDLWLPLVFGLAVLAFIAAVLFAVFVFGVAAFA